MPIFNTNRPIIIHAYCTCTWFQFSKRSKIRVKHFRFVPLSCHANSGNPRNKIVFKEVQYLKYYSVA